jgi:hypothetical protein
MLNQHKSDTKSKSTFQFPNYNITKKGSDIKKHRYRNFSIVDRSIKDLISKVFDYRLLKQIINETAKFSDTNSLSIGLEFFNTTMLAACIYLIYFGIEISHPLYAVLFCNLVVALVSSFIIILHQCTYISFCEKY